MKSFEWAMALLFGSISVFFLSVSLGIMFWIYQKLMHPLPAKPLFTHILDAQCVDFAEYEDNLKECVINNSRPV